MHVVAGHLRRSTTHAAYRTIAGSPATAAIRTVVANELDTVFVEISVSTRKTGLAKGIWCYAPTLRALPAHYRVLVMCAATAPPRTSAFAQDSRAVPRSRPDPYRLALGPARSTCVAQLCTVGSKCGT
jgi:hypothetical protein